MPLSQELKASYTSIIDGILGVSDLKTISSKQIRKGLQSAVDHDITPQKEAINELIVERFDVAEGAKTSTTVDAGQQFDQVSDDQKDVNASIPSSRKKREKDSDDISRSEDTSPRPTKIKRASHDKDAALAARLQAEENSRARATRGSASGKRQTPTKPVKKKKSKSAARIKTTDDSDPGSGSEDEKTVERNGAFHKPYMLSSPLAQLVGETTLSRPQTVKKIWEYVRQHNLQNPDDKRQILCDESMKAVFKQDSVHMFTMNKILTNHLYPVEE